MGDTSLSAEAARLVVRATVGGKSVDNVAITSKSTSSLNIPPNAFRYAVSSSDSARRFFLYVNDCAASSGLASDCDPNQNPANAVDVQLTINLASWGLPAGTVVPVTIAGANSMGEVQQLAVISPSGTVSVFSPTASTMLITGHLSGQQGVTVLATTDDATISPGATTNGGFLGVSTSSSADHTNTQVALLRFSIPSTATPSALTSAILELTLATPPSEKVILTVFGAACNTAWSEGSVSWSSAGAFAVNSSIPMNAQITRLAQNFQYIDATTTVVGHITVLPSMAAGQVLRIDVADYAASCAGKAITLSISRRLRNPLYTGNVVGNIAADTLSNGASVQFYSGEATTGVPQLRLLSSTSLATGVMSLSVPGSAAATPAGRKLLQGGPTSSSVAAVSSTLSRVLAVPVTVAVASYSIYFEVTIQGLPYTNYVSQTQQTALLAAMSDDLSEPMAKDVRNNAPLPFAGPVWSGDLSQSRLPPPAPDSFMSRSLRFTSRPASPRPVPPPPLGFSPIPTTTPPTVVLPWQRATSRACSKTLERSSGRCAPPSPGRRARRSPRSPPL